MSELIVMARNNGDHAKGMIISLVDDGYAETFTGLKLPDFVVVKIPLTKAQAKQYRTEWRSDLQFSVISSDVSTDTYTIGISSSTPGISGEGNVTRAQVEEFLNSWNLTVNSVSANQVTFDASIYQAAISEAFWSSDVVQNIVFAETDYIQTGGTHTISADYNALLTLVTDPVKRSRIASAFEKRIASRGGVLISNQNGIAIFTIERATVRAAFQDDVKQQADKMIKRRRWSFLASDVDAAIAAGGYVTITQTQLLAKLRDALNG